MTTSPPPYLLASFDPKGALVSQLRGILLEHDVPYPSGAKKGDLVALYESQIRPQAPRILAALRRVQPSNVGIVDGESQSGSLVELDTGSESADAEAENEKVAGRKGKKVKSKKVEKVEKKSKSSKGKGRKKVEEETEEEEEDQMEVEEPAPIKRATQAKSRKSKVVSAVAVAEPSSSSSESEEEPALPKKRKAAAIIAPSSAEKDRRQSLKYESGGESGFSDFNPFQSGAEDTPERKLKRRKSSMGPNRRSTLGGPEAPPTPLAGPSHISSARKSLPAHTRAGAWTNANDESDVASSPAVASHLTGAARRQTFGGAPGTPAGVGSKYMVPLDQVKRTPPEAVELKRRLSRFEPQPVEPELEPEEEDFEMETEEPEVEQEEYEHPVDFGDDVEEEEEEQQQQPAQLAPRRVASFVKERVADVAPTPVKRLGRPSSATTTPLKQTAGALTRRPSTKSPAGSKAIVVRRAGSSVASLVKSETTQRWSAGTFLVFLLCFVSWWREEKLAAGFCDTPTALEAAPSNALVASRGRGSLALSSSSLAPYLPTLPDGIIDLLDSTHLRPTCTPCPAHARCSTALFLGCDPDFQPRPHPLRLGGLLPLPPSCEPDTEKLMIVAGQASRIARVLRGRKGEVICETGMGGEKRRRKVAEREGRGGAWVFGLASEDLWERLRGENAMSAAPYKDEFLEEVNRLALRDLENHGEILVEQDGDNFYYATQAADMPLSCQARLALVKHANEHRRGLTGLISAIISALYLQAVVKSRKAEKEKVRELVKLVLGELRKQEYQHHLDPALAPEPHLAQSHLRDYILQQEHSPTARQRLWSKVERVVEGNANVRAKTVEHQGEELRAWEWTGQGGLGAIESATPGGKGLYPALKL